jgi:hypothetical protein
VIFLFSSIVVPELNSSCRIRFRTRYKAKFAPTLKTKIETYSVRLRSESLSWKNLNLTLDLEIFLVYKKTGQYPDPDSENIESYLL